MALQKHKKLLIKGCLIMSLILSGCGGQPLSEREIVRGILFTNENHETYSVCLIFAKQQEDSSEPLSNQIVAAQGTTPAQALEYAEESLDGDAYYGLLDLVALPSNTTWHTAQEIGTLLYEIAQPAPEVSVFLMDSAPVESWASEGNVLYNAMKTMENTNKVHCGLQQLFTQKDVCAIPAYNGSDGYDFVLLPQNGDPLRCQGLAEAQLAAVLCGQTTRLQGTYAAGEAACDSRAQITVAENTIQLHLRETKLRALTGKEIHTKARLVQELTDSFTVLYSKMKKSGVDPFHLNFWYACEYGFANPQGTPSFSIVFE